MTTTLDKLDTINDSLNDIKTAVIAKGQTPSGNITTYATAINNIVKLNGETVNITPTTSQQIITPTSPANGITQATVAAVTAAIDSNITSSNIKSGITILNVTGNVTELNGETRTETLTSSAGNTFTPSSGKNAITSITVTPNNQARSVTPSTSLQSLTVNSGYSGNGTITVNPVTSSIDANITAENIKKDVTILGVTGSLESGGGAYQLRRIKDDNNNEIGTAYMEFEDANGNKYDVVLLDARYRNGSAQWCSSSSSITNLPLYSNIKTKNLWASKETATSNTQKILDWCSANSQTSAACSHCRSKSFVINGTTYYGQLPNAIEVVNIAMHYNEFDSLDTSASSQSSLNFSTAQFIVSSNQYNNAQFWFMHRFCMLEYTFKNEASFVCPVLEIPK